MKKGNHEPSFDISSPVLTQKQIKLAKEAKQKKRKTIAYTILGIACAVAAAALLIWNSNFFQARVTAVTIGTHEYTANDVNYYYTQAYSTTYYYAQYGLSDYDTSTDPSEQIYDEDTGETYEDYFVQSAIDSLISVTALVDAADEAGYTLSEDADAQIDEVMTSLEDSAAEAGYTTEAYLKAQYGDLMTKKAYKNILKRSLLASEYYQYYSDSLTYDDEQVQEYYDENAASLDTYTYNYAYIDGTAETTTDANGETVEATDAETEAAMQNAKEIADQFNDRLQAGEDFSTVAADLLGENDTSSTNISSTGDSLSSTYSDFLTDDTRAVNDSEVAESSSGYYVVQFLGRSLDETPTQDARIIYIAAEISDGASTPDETQMSAASTTASSVLEQWSTGDATQESFESLAEQYSSDSTSSDGGAYDYIYDGQLTSSMGEDMNSWLFSTDRAAGDTTIIESTTSSYYGYLIVYYVGQDKPYWQYKAVNSMRDEDVSTWESDLESEYTATEQDGMKYVL